MSDSNRLDPEPTCGETKAPPSSLRSPSQEANTLPAVPSARPDPGQTLAASEEPEAAIVVREDWPAVDGYEIVGHLGQGGMGIVYKARHLKLNRFVALKMIRGKYDVPAVLARFRTEAQAIARLQHANIVQIHDVGEQHSHPYLALELVEGGNLAQRLDGTPRPPGDAARPVETLARAIHAAHVRGIVHRDLKPSNILLTPEATPKITDFGLAKLIDTEENQTLSGAILGTPSYMAPEQSESKYGSIGPATDVYALGAILYELVTGRPPFKGATPFETAAQVVSLEPVPPLRLQPRLPRDLDTICLKCLEKVPAKRYLSAQELAEDLGRFLSAKPIMARPIGQVERLAKWARRRPALASLVVVSLVAAVSLLIGGMQFMVRVRAERDRADGERIRADALRHKAEMQSATRALERGLSLCEQGEVARGLLWLARSLEETPGDAEDLKTTIRTSLAEWHRSVHRLTQLLIHGGGPVDAVAFSPDGKSIVTGGEDGQAKQWDAATGQAIGSPLLHRGFVRAVAYSPDGRWILTGSSDKENRLGEARLWEVASGKPWGRPLPHPGGVLAAAFSLDGRLVLTGCADKKARLWSPISGELVRELVGHQDEVVAVGFNRDGKWLITASKDKTARLWETASGKSLLKPLAHQDTVHSVAFSPDGKYVLTGSGIGLGQLWATSTGKQQGLPLKHRAPVLAVAFSPDGSVIATASQDRTVRLWTRTSQPAGQPFSFLRVVEPDAPQPMGQPLAFLGHPRTLAFSPDGKTVLTGSLDGSARLWKVATPNVPIAELPHSAPVAAVATSPDGRFLLTGSADLTLFREKGEARLWDAATRALLHSLPHPLPVVAVAFSPDGARFATGCGHPYKGPGEVRLWETASGRQIGQPLAHNRAVAGLAFSPDGCSLLTASNASVAVLWDLATQRSIHSFVHPEGVFAVAFSPDGGTILTGADDGVARLWDLRTGKRTGPQFRHQALILGVAFSPDGKSVLTGSADYTARLWDRETGDLRATFQHNKEIRPVAFSPDAKLVLTGSMDQTARLWNAGTGKQVGAPLRHPSWVADASFSRDGRQILTAGAWADRAYLWNAAPAHLEGDPGQLVLWTQLITGMRLDLDDSVQILDPTSWQNCRKDLQDRPSPPPL